MQSTIFPINISKKMKVHPEQEDPLLTQFCITVSDISNIIETYRQRKLVEELELISEHGGLTSIVEKLRSNHYTGLSSHEDHECRIKCFGDNKPPKDVKLTYLQICWETLKDLTLRILTVSGIISLIIGATIEDHPEYGWIEGFAIIAAVAVVVNVTAVNDLQKQKKFTDLKNQNRSTRTVGLLRDGIWSSVHPNVLLVGDVVKLENGVTIPADGILLEASSVEVVEAAMTGENQSIKKLSCKEALIFQEDYLRDNPGIKELSMTEDKHHDIPSPVMLSGTNLAEGMGLMLVLAVGKNSAEGRIMELAEQYEESTPLMKKLDSLAENIGKAGIIFAVVTMLGLYLRFVIEITTGRTKWSNSEDPGKLVGYFIIGITVLVVAIPEGLPLAVTISLAYSIKKMQQENNLVRKMYACETMGGADMICSDKTGTLTQNKMTVNEYWAGNTFSIQETPPLCLERFSTDYLRLLKEAVFTNTSAFFDAEKGEQGSKSEIALLLMMKSLGYSDYVETRQIYNNRFNKIFPFSSKRKRSSILVSMDDGQQRLHVKGAGEIVIDYCTHYLTSEGSLSPIDPSFSDLLHSVITKMTEKALRVLALAYKEVPRDVNIEEIDEKGFPSVETSGLILIGLAGIRDPLRLEVPKAVRTCQRAGITVRMVTGDNKETAKAIAKDCFIITSEDQTVLEGKEFSSITGGTVCETCRTKLCPCPRNPKEAGPGQKLRKDVVANLEAFKTCVKSMAVLARSAPEDKYTLVCGLREMGHVVAVTGDGTNDAPALRKADIGFAMGIAGTEMAKEAAGIILLDDNFTSIVRAVVWGRNIYDNIRSFLQFQLTVNIVAVLSAVTGAVTIQQSPLTSVQLLWVNLIMDSLASLALATDPPTDAHLERPPHKRDAFIIENHMWKHIIGQSLLQLALMFAMVYDGENFLPEFEKNNKFIVRNGEFVGNGRLYDFQGNEEYLRMYNDPNYGPSRHFTYVFNIFVLLQLCNEINSRKLRDEFNVLAGLQRNWLFIVIWIVTFFIQVLVVQLGSYAFSCNFNGLTIYQWLISIGIGSFALLWRMILLLIPSNIFPEVICM